MKQRPNFAENVKLNASFDNSKNSRFVILSCACLFRHNRLSTCVNFSFLGAELSSPLYYYPLLSPMSQLIKPFSLFLNKLLIHGLSLTFDEKLLHQCVCIKDIKEERTALLKYVWWQYTGLQRERGDCDSIATVQSWQNTPLYLDFMLSFPRK